MRKFNPGDLVQHFKYERLSSYEKSLGMCEYEVICEANHTETGKPLVIYKSIHSGEIYARDKESFYSKVDKNKYPDIQQEYRFIKVNTEIEEG